jgi:3-dehydroquinate synthase
MESMEKLSKVNIVYTNKLNEKILKKENVLVIYDQFLNHFPDVKKFISKYTNYPVDAGEELKNIEHFAGHIKNILNLTAEFSVSDMTILAIGGGTVGDFSGFVASVFKRGVKLIHVPSTWLSAIDSAHGGKTALNVPPSKNQIGTFYQAQKIIIIKELLFSQPPERSFDALGELLKILLLCGTQSKWAQFFKNKIKNKNQLLWDNLPWAISSKYKIVKKDPFEKSGLRQILNLGHTLGHVLELEWSMSHGVAVQQGLCFALNWSLQNKLMTKKTHHLIFDVFTKFEIHQKLDQISLKNTESILLKDKKNLGNSKVNFIFLKSFGKVIREPVKISDLVIEMRRQGYKFT